MKRFQQSSFLKGLAFVLLPIALIIAISTMISLQELKNFGYSPNRQYKDSYTYESLLKQESWKIADALIPREDFYKQYDSSKENNFDTFSYYDSEHLAETELVNNKQVDSTSLDFWFWPSNDSPAYSNDAKNYVNVMKLGNILKNYDYIYYYHEDYFIATPSYPLQTGFYEVLPTQGYIAFSVKENLPLDSPLLSNKLSYENATQLYRILLPLLIISIVLGFLSFSYLVFSAGHGKSKHEISSLENEVENESDKQPSIDLEYVPGIDRVPIEILLLLSALLFAGFLALTIWLHETWLPFPRYLSGSFTIPEDVFAIRLMHGSYILLPLALGIMVLEVSGLSIVRQLKARSFTKNSLIVKLLRFIAKTLLKFLHFGSRILQLLIAMENRSKLLRLLIVYIIAIFISLLIVFLTWNFFFFVLFLILLIALPISYFFIRQWRSLIAIENLELQMAALRRGDFSSQATAAQLPLEFVPLANELSDMRGIIKEAVERESKSERLKTELITNVSHDLRTPLTSIINYVDLLKQETFSSPKAQEYLLILEQKSAKLRQLTEDLIEASRALSGNLSYNPEIINLPELLRQQLGEYSERFEKKNLEMILRLPEFINPSAAEIQSDPRHLARILDNLLSNCSKYALPGSRVYLSLFEHAAAWRIEIKNISSERLDKNIDDLFERFVRGDESRSDSSNGLGLSIAKSLAEQIGAVLEIRLDDDLFIVNLTLPSILTAEIVSDNDTR